MRILITGTTGRIGSLLAKALIEQGHQVRGLVWPRDRRVERFKSLPVELLEGSIASASDCARACDGVEVIYHLGAAFQGGGPFSSEEYFEINLRGTFNMVEAAAKQSSLQHFAFASTDAVYNKYPPEGLVEPIREDEMQVAPEGWSRYGTSKAAGELLCRAAGHRDGVPVTIFRFCFVRDASEMLDWEQWRLKYWMEKVHSELDRVRRATQIESLETTIRTLHALWSGYEPLFMPRDAQGRPFKKHIADTSRQCITSSICRRRSGCWGLRRSMLLRGWWGWRHSID